MPIKPIKSFWGQSSVDALKINQSSYYNLPYSMESQFQNTELTNNP